MLLPHYPYSLNKLHWKRQYSDSTDQCFKGIVYMYGEMLGIQL